MEKEQKPEEEQTWITEGYTAGQAAKIMTKNSGRPVTTDYVRQLAQKKYIRSLKINASTVLYNKEDVDGYKVEARGAKASRAAKKRAAAKRRRKAPGKKPDAA